MVAKHNAFSEEVCYHENKNLRKKAPNNEKQVRLEHVLFC